MTIVTLSGTPVAASSLISRAMRLLEQLSPGVDPTTDEYATGLTALNAMLDSWRNEALMSIALLDESFTLVPGQASYTVGSGGDFNTNRPVRIEGAYLVDNGAISYGVNIIQAAEYAYIGLKTSTSTLPNYLYYASDMDSGHIWVYPVPSVAYEMHCLTWTPYMAYTTKDTTALLAPGHEDAIVYNLALRIAPEFEKQPSPLVMQTARDTKAGIKRANMRPLKMKTELAGLINRSYSNILTNC